MTKTFVAAVRRRKASAARRSTRSPLRAQAQRALAESQAAEKIRAADERIASAKTQALANVEQIAVDAAASIVEKLTGAKIDQAALAKHATSSN